MKVTFFQKHDRIFGGSFKSHFKFAKNRAPIYWALTVHDGNKSMWYSKKDKKWKNSEEEWSSTLFVKSWSIKSALRHLRKHTEIPKGATIYVCSHISGYDIIIKK